MADIEKIQQTEDLVDKKKADAEQVYNQGAGVSGDSWADELMSDDVRKQPQAPKKVQSAPKGTGDTWADAMMSDDVRNVKQPVSVEQPVEQNTQPAPVKQVENVDNNQYKGEDLGQITVTYDKSTNKQTTSVAEPVPQEQPSKPLYDYTKAPEWRGEPDSWRYTRTIKTYDEGHPLAQAARQAKQYGSLLSADELSAVYANKDWDDLNRQSQELMRNNPTRPKGGTPQFEHDAQLLSAIHNQMVALEYNFADRNDMYRNIGQKNYRMFLEPMRKGNKYTEFYENLYNSGANLRKSNPLLLDLPDKVEAQKAADEKAGKKKPDNYYFNMALKDKDFKERYHAWSFFGSIQDNMGWNEYKNLGAKASDLREERYKEELAKRFAESSLYAPVSALLDNSVAQAVMAVGNAYDVIKGQPLRSESVNDLLQRSMKYAGEGNNVARGVLSFIPEAVSIMPVTGVAATKTVGALSKVFTFTPRAMKITTGGLSFMGFEMAKSALGSWSQGREIDWAEMAGNSAKGFLLGAGGSLISEGVAGIKPNINSTVANYAIQGAGKVAETGLFASTEMAMAYLGNDKEATWTSSLLNNGALIISMAIGHGIGNGFGFKSRIGNATIEKVRKAGYNTLANEMAKHTQAVERGAMPKGYSQAAIEEMQSMQQSMGSNGLSWSDYAEVLKPTNSKMTKPGTNSIEKVEDGKGYRIVSYDVNGVEIERSKVYDEVAVDKEFVKRQRAVEKKQEEANVKSFDLMRDSTIKAKAARSVADRINFDDGKSVYNGDGTVNEAFDGITADDVLYAYEVLSEKPAEQRSSDEARIVALFDEAVRDYGAEMPDSNAVKKTLCERYGIEESAFDAAWKADAKDRKGREAEICATYNSIMSRPYEVALNGGEAGMVDGRQVSIKSAVKTDAEGMPLNPNQRVYYDDGTGVKVTTAEHVLMEPTVEDPGELGDRIANENLRKALEAKKEALKSMFAEIPTDVLESNLDIARTAIENGEDTDGSMRLSYIALEEEIQRRRDSGVEETIAPATEESAPIEIDADGNVIEGEGSAPIEINERGEVIEPEQPIEAPKADNEIKPVAVPEAESNASNPKDKIDELLDAMGFEKKEERDEQRAFYEDKNNEEQFEKDYRDFVGKRAETIDDSQQEVKAVDPLDEPMPKDEKGKVVMRKASTRRTRKYLYEDLGLSKEDADSIVDYELEKATKAQEDYAQKKKRPTIKDKGIDGDPEKLKQKLDEYDAAAKTAQDDVRYWEEVKRMGEEPVEPESKPESKPEPSAQNAGEANTVGNEVKEKWNNAPKVYGKSDTMRLENGTKLNGRYVLAPSGSASASHDANNNYNQTPGFPVDGNGNTANSRDYRGNASYRQTTERHGENYNENAIQDRVVVSKDGVVLSGNGRTMAGELAARHNTDKEYIDYLREHAEDFGFTREQVDSMEHPRVLFEVQEDLPYTAETFDMFNKGKEKVENKTESAVRLGKTTPAETISKVLEIIDQFDNIGDFNNNNQAPIDVLRELASAGVITQNEINALMENGKLSPQGKDFIENLLVGNIFASDPDAVRILSNNADVRQKVVTGLSALTSNARLGGGYSLVDEITTAIKLIANEREGNLERGSTMQAITTSFDFGEDYGSTPTEAFTNQLVITLTEMLNGKRVREFKEFLDSYNNEAEVSAGGETRMFGNLGTKEEIFNFIIDNFKNGRYKKSRDARAGAGQGEGERAGDEEAGAGPENPRADAGQGVGGEDGTRFRDGEGDAGVAEPEDGNAPTFYSNAARAVEGIKQNKATAEQWKAMLTKAGGLKAGEDKWMGLSQWLEDNKGKSLTKEEVQQFIADNGIKVEEVNYAGVGEDWITLRDVERAGQTAQGRTSISFERAKSLINMLVGDFYEFHIKDIDNQIQKLEGLRSQEKEDLEGEIDPEYLERGQRRIEEINGDIEFYSEVKKELEKQFPPVENPVNSTRLDYTTKGLDNKREIAFKVPNIEPYQEHDEVHFGPENQGKAVMWVRFGETTDADGNRVLVIDEIQSNRHQDAREKGYRNNERYNEYLKSREEGGAKLHDFFDRMRKKYNVERNDEALRLLSEEEEAERLKYFRAANGFDWDYEVLDRGVPAAPFEKNWHEVAMKRMLRLAAEEGFDKVAWTTGEQQAKRYSLGRMYDSIEREDNPSIDGKRFVLSGRNMDTFVVNKEGNIEDSSFSEFNGKPLSDVVGKDLAERMMNLEDGDMLEGEDLRIGGEGMKGFYDKMLPRFMDKYGKRWGTKTGEVQLATPGKEVMHAVDVTPEMKESVMQGQPLFRQQEPMGERGVKKVTQVTEPQTYTLKGYDGVMRTYESKPGQYKVEGYDDIFNSVEEVADFMRKKNPDYCVYIDEDGNIGYEAWSNILPEGMKPNTYAKILASNGGKLSSAMKKRIERYTQREMKQARVRAEEITKELGLDVEFHDDPSEFTGRKAKAKGWYDPKTGKIHIVMGNHSGVSDVMATMLHEGVAHHGLRKLFGEDFDTFLDNVHNNVSEDIRTDIDGRIEKMRAADQEGAHSDEYYRRAATEEYLADLAEDGLYNGEQNTGYASRAWQWIKENFINMLRKAGINIELSDDELRYILWSSHKNLRRGAETMVEDAVMREKAGIKDYVEDGEPVKTVAEGDVRYGNEEVMHKQQESNNFKNWFGDWENDPENASKVVDEDGRPLVMSHNTSNEFYTFDRERIGTGQGQAYLGAGFNFSRTGNGAYGNNEMKVYLDARNPLESDGHKLTSRDVENVLRQLDEGQSDTLAADFAGEYAPYGSAEYNRALRKAVQNLMGYDDLGIVGSISVVAGTARANDIIDAFKKLGFDSTIEKDNDGRIMNAVVFDNTQIKSATENNGEFSRENSDIRFRDGEEGGRDYAAEMRELMRRRLRGEDVTAELEQLRADRRAAEAARSTESNGAGSGEPPAEPPTPPAPASPEPAPEPLPPTGYDRPMSPIEMAQEAAIKVVADTKASLEQRNTARRELDASLKNLHKAMRLQKEYDRTTVENVVGLCKMMVKSGLIDRRYISNLTPLFTKLKDSTGKEDLTSTVNGIMDVMLKSQERSIRNEINTLLNTKTQKVNQSGVVTQGGVDIRGQRTLESLNKNFGNSVEDIDREIQRLEELRGRIPENSEERLNGVDDKIQGALLAKAYMETAKNHEDNIKAAVEELDEIKAQYKDGELSIKEYTEQKRALEAQIRSYRMSHADAMWDYVNTLRGIVAEGRSRAKDFIEAQKAHKNEIRHNAYSDMAGTPQYTQSRPDRLAKISSSSISKAISASLYTFDEMLRTLGRKHANGEGYLYERFGRGWLDARDREIIDYWADRDVLDAKTRELFGVKHFANLIDTIRKMPKMDVPYKDGGDIKNHTLDQSQLMYIYMVNKMEDGIVKLRRMGISEENVETIKNFMNPKLVELADWLQDDFLPSKREGYNEVHRRMFGADMDMVENYVPLRIDKGGLGEKVDINNGQNEPSLASTVTGGIIKRTHNTTALDLMNTNAIDMILGHLDEMNHWKHFAEWSRDVNTLLSDRTFRNKVKNTTTIYGSGDLLWKRLKDTFFIAGGTYKPQGGDFDKVVVGIAKNVSAAKVSMRVFTATKQLLSLPVFAANCNVGYMVKNMAKPAGSWNWCMENLPSFKHRWKSRIAGDTRLEDTDIDWKYQHKKWVERASKWGLTPNAFVDAMTVAVGAKSVYEQRYKRYRKDGYDDVAADRRARQDATVAFNQTQQSSEKMFVAPMQVDRGGFAVGASLFRSASMGYERQLVAGLRNLKHLMGKERVVDEDGNVSTVSYKEASIDFMTKQMTRNGIPETQARENAERIYRRSKWRNALKVAMFSNVAQFAWNIGGKLPYMAAMAYLVGSNWKDDDKRKAALGNMWDTTKEAAIHALACGWFEGLPFGNVVSDGVNNEINKENFFKYSPDLLPIFGDIEDVGNHFDGKNKLRGATDLVNLGAQIFVGVNPQTFTDAITGIVDSCFEADKKDEMSFGTAKEALLLTMRVMQVPQSQLDQLYIDELKMSAREAQNLTPEQLARRYAYYKAHREAPALWWMYNQEKQDELIKDYEKNFSKKLNDDVKEAGGTPEDYHDLMDSSTTNKEHDKYRKKEIDALSAQGPEALMKAWEKERDKGAAADYKYIKSLMTRYQKDVYGKGKTPDDADEAYEALHGEDIKEQALKIGRDLGFGAQDSYFQMSQYKAQHTSAKDPIMKEFSENGGGFKYSKKGKFFKMEDYTYKVPVKDPAKRAKALKVIEEHPEELRRNYRNGMRMAKIKALYKDIEAESLKKERDHDKMKAHFAEIIQILEDERKDAAEWEKKHPAKK